MHNKIIFVVFDGLGDRPIAKFDGLTPLEAAKTPNLDFLAKIGINGLSHTIKRGIRPGSDVAHLSLFGYDPKKYYTGRGIFEAAGIGMDLKKGDIAFRANAGTIDENGIITDRRAGRIESTEEFTKLIDGLKIEDVEIRVKAGTGHRMAIVLRGPGLSYKITDPDPHKTEEKIRISTAKDSSKEAEKTARIINELVKKANQLFTDHPLNQKRKQNNLPLANAILLRGAGEVVDFPNFKDKYAMKACCIAGGGLYKGIAKMLGMDIIAVEGATGKPDTNINAKIQVVQSQLEHYDFLFLHLKGTDACAEDGDFTAKKEYLERADREFEPIVRIAKENKATLVVTGDHTTACELKAHSAEPVPILITGKGVRIDKVEKFGERAAVCGGLGQITGLDIMPYLVNLSGNQPLYGN